MYVEKDTGRIVYEIGETFKLDGKTIKCVKGEDCANCYFANKPCGYLKCGNTREDHTRVKFIEIKTDMPEEKKSILEEAAEIRKGSRNSDYGDAVINFKKIATIASEIAGRDISPRECVAVQIATKLSRESYKHKRDNLVDLCGYADIMEEIAEFEDHYGSDADPRLRNM